MRYAQVKAVSDTERNLDQIGKLSDHDSWQESSSEEEATSEQSCGDIDLFVHEVSKLFGYLGTPEYCHGALAFKRFLKVKSEPPGTVKIQKWMKIERIHIWMVMYLV